jgi:hypothetical protein
VPAATPWTLPDDWQSIERSGPMRFVTRELARRPDGVELEFRSRPYRKGREPQVVVPAGRARPVAARRPGLRVQPYLGRGMALLFMIGAACFAVASAPGASSALPTAAVGTTFFVGSIFFTSAAYLQFVESINSGRAGPERLVAWQPGRIDFWSTGVQLVGTLWFNLDTFDAIRTGLDTEAQLLRVWTPDFLGSICFLVSSWLALQEVCHRWYCAETRDVSWQIVAVNLAGSIVFMVSAVAAFVRPATGQLFDASLANAATCVGGLCFFWGARLLFAELPHAPVVSQAR